MSTKSKLLFILKYRDAHYSDENYSNGGLSSGLLNSATFVTNMLKESGIECSLVQVQDNNCIDKVVSDYKPTHVIIEAFWVVPDKFEILSKLHPSVKWIIRNHSEIPFLATEGIATDWIMRYLHHTNVYIASNSDRAYRETRTMAHAKDPSKNYSDKVLYLPNFYTFSENTVSQDHCKNNDTLDISCFGAIRPLKNQLIQAVAAIQCAKEMGKKLNFHINATRIEGGGNNTLKNIQALFANSNERYKLIEHTWSPHDQFVKLCATMDLSMCVSFTETFCIVAADCVSMGVPIIVSDDIRWATSLSKADPTSSKDIVRKMKMALFLRKTGLIQKLNLRGLTKNIKKAKRVWESYFK